MDKATPPEPEASIRYWAMLTIIEQCSLALVRQTFPLPKPRHTRKRSMREAAGSERRDRQESPASR